MGLYHLDRIFRPKTIAVIGASEKPGTIGNAITKNLNIEGIQHTLFLVNPNYRQLHGLQTYPSILKIDSEIDLAVIATPIATVPAIVDECIQKKVGGAIIISAGGKEIGEKGRELEENIRKTAYKGGLRIVGPNCFGIISPYRRLNASFSSDMPTSGNLAFVSQSGAMCAAILDLAFRENIGFSHFVSTGSMIDVDFGDMIDYLGNEPSAKSILLYIESLTNFRKFMSAARSVSRVKPIVVLKAGKSAAGARAAASHTGALAGEDAVYDAAFKRAGVVRVDTIQELFDCAELMAKQPRPAGNRLAIVTNGGGPGVMATDALASYGLEPATIPSETMQKLNEILPPFWSRNNPIDILGDATPERFAKTIEICLETKEFDGLLVIQAPQALTDPNIIAKTLIDTIKKKTFPIFASWMGGKSMENAVSLLNQAGIPTYETPERAVRSFLYMVEYSRNQEMLRQIPPKFPQNLQFDRDNTCRLMDEFITKESGFLTEIESKKLLASYGIPVNMTEIATSEEDAVAKAKWITYPLVMKLLSPDITHKTEANGVHLDLRNEYDVRKAYQAIMDGARAYNPNARIEGVTVQSYIRNPDYELLIGAKRDENFGPVILFGMGGIFTEVMKDRAIGLPPLNRLLAHRLIESTRIYSLLKGYRNRPQANMELLEEILIRLSQLLVDFPQIAELDMNPVVIKNGIPQAVDARILLKPLKTPSPLHLVISPYPEQYEFHEVTDDNVKIFIRPVKPEDAPLFVELFKVLSPTSIYYRFFSPLKSLSPEMLARFTQIDYDREIALVALDDSEKQERMLGVARIVGDPDRIKGEFAVLVGDPWQGVGIGAKLLSRCLHIAKNMGLQIVSGTALRANRHMLKLAEKLGFKFNPVSDPELVDLTIDLSTLDFDVCATRR